MDNPIRGAGGGGGDETPRAPIEAPDSLRSVAYATILDLVSEGEIIGFADQVNPLTCVYLNETPIQNADGSKNFKNFQIDSRTGTQTQDYFRGFDSVDSELGVGVELIEGVPWTRSITNLNLSAVRMRLSVPALMVQDATNGDTNGYKIAYKIELATDGGSFVERLTSSFDGKTSTKYERGHRIDLPPAVTTGWVIRVTRITPNSASGLIQDTTIVESIAEILDGKFRMPMSAAVALIVDSSQFNNIPSRGYRLKGRIIQVPSNYNAVTRVYTGIWNGTFQPAYTTNPAWVFYDMAINNRYGLGHLISTDLIDKWALYKIAKYCDGWLASGEPLRAAGVTTGAVSISVNATTNQYVRAAGSFLTDGFLVGDAISASDFASSFNNGDSVITALTATAMTVSKNDGLVTAAAAAGKTIALRTPMEPRFSANVYLQSQDDALRVMQNLSSIFRGMMYASGGAITAVGDMPDDPIYTYTPANVIDGKFIYSGSSRKVRHTVALVSWNDMNDFGRAKVEYIEDEEGIARYGIQQTEVVAIGSTSQGQARRLGKYILTTERYETDTVSFGVGLDGTFPAPGKVIRIADPLRANRRMGGRIKSATVNSVVLDGWPIVAPVAGDTLVVILPTGIAETRSILSVNAGTFTVTVTVNFSAVPIAQSIWALESPTLSTQRFRVLGVSENSETIGYTINCVQHVEGKYDFVELGVLIQEPTITAASVLTAPTFLTAILSNRYDDFDVIAIIQVDWVPVPTAAQYGIQWKRGNDEWSPIIYTASTSYDITGVIQGSYKVRVFASNKRGMNGPASTSVAVVVPIQSIVPASIATAQAVADAAAADAAAANARLAAIASDGLLTPNEKPLVIKDRDDIINEQGGIDTQATLYGITTEKTTYDSAVTALVAYLATLTSAVLWSDLSGDTTIVGATFRTKFLDVYNSRQALLNKILARAKELIATAQLDATTAIANAAAAQTAANDAAADANAANAELANIASDGLLTPNEKPVVIMNRDDIINEQSDIDAKATLYGITTEKTNYDSAVTALTTYLATLTSAVLWSNLTGNTTIVGTTFRTKFLDVYTKRQLLLNRIAAKAKELADAAQAAADAAQAAADASQVDANAANAELANIASDSLLTPGEKPVVIQNRDEIINGQPGIDTQATAYAITTEKTTYDNAVTALVAYLATLTTPVLWSSTAGNTTIVGATFRTKFLDVYNARTALLQKIADVVTYGNTAANGTNILWDEYTRFPTATLPPLSASVVSMSTTVDARAIGGRFLTGTTGGVGVSNDYVYFGSSGVNYNLSLSPGKYIVSYYALASVFGHAIKPFIINDAAVVTTGADQALTGQVVRYHVVLNIPAGTNDKAILGFYMNRSGVAGRIVSIDRIMVEPMIGGVETPSPWTPGAAGRQSDNAIFNAAAAQADALAAQVDADAANAELANIASDSLLTPGEKPIVIQNRDEIINEQADIDAKATSYGITTEKTTYDSAVTALTAYLATLTSAVLWSNTAGNTTIVGATFRSKFLDVYEKRQLLLNRIAAEAGERANWEEILRGPVDPLNLVRQPKWQDVLDADVMWATNYGVGTGIKADVFATAATPNGTTNVLRWNSTLSGIWIFEQGPGLNVEPLQRFKIRALLYLSAAGSVAAQLRFQKIDGTYVFGTTSANTTVVGAWTWCEGFVEAPANAKLMWPALTTTGTNTGYCAEISITRAMSLDTDVEDGTDYGRYSLNDGYINGGFRRIGLRYGASGHRLGDQRNMVMVRTGSTGSRWSGAAITYTIPTTGAPAVVNIAVASGSLQCGSVAVSYNAANANVNQTRSTTVTYYLYYIDATYAGGAKTLNITTDAANLSNADDRVYIGTATVTVPALGTGGSGGGGNEGGCVDGAMWIDTTRQAEKIVAGDWIDTVDERKLKPTVLSQRVQNNVIDIQPCYRIRSEGGAVVIASETTPMTLRNGEFTTIGDMLNREVIVDQDGVLRWERIVEVSFIGNRPVARISVNSASYFAGVNPRYRIATHNPLKP